MVSKLSPVQKAYAILLRDEGGYTFREIARKCRMSKSSAHRLWQYRQKYVNRCNSRQVERKRGPKRRLGERERRLIERTMKRMRATNCNFTVMTLVREAGIDPTIAHRRTFTRYLNNWGYHFLQSRKKGLLSDKDKELRLRHARTMKRVLQVYPDFYTDHIAFYLDGVSFVHKFNPMSEAAKPKARVWRKKGEGLTVTAKGSKELAGGRRLHLMVAVAHGKGVILCEPYEKLNGEFFANFIQAHFKLTLAKAGPKVNGQRLLVMDNDPSQTSRRAMKALHGIEAELHRLPSRSQDLNPPENVFHFVKKRLEKEALENNITRESFEAFTERVLRCFHEMDIHMIDKTIESLPHRIDAIIRLAGGRTKY